MHKVIKSYTICYKRRYSHCTVSIILLLTVGGIPFEAMHRYAPICNRFILVILKINPSTILTVTKSNAH